MGVRGTRKRTVGRTVAVIALLVALAACGAATPPSASDLRARANRCKLPSAGADFSPTNPSDQGVNADAVKAVIDRVGPQLTGSLRIYRHRCLIGRMQNDDNTKQQPMQFFSMTKTVVALLVGRAVTLGKLDIDDPISRYVPEADTAHGAITVRQLLNQNSGLTFAWANDLLGSLDDSVSTALTLPFAHEPGTFFEYAQTTVTLLGYVVERAVGADLQRFARNQLFRPIGIDDREWFWARDAKGHTHGYAWLAMTPIAAARLGTLVLDRGRWANRQIVTARYVSAMGAPTTTNESYGFLTPSNKGTAGWTSFGRNRFEGRRYASAPPDMVVFSGFLEQDIFVIPSLDLVITRFGFPPPAGWDYEMFRTLMPATEGANVKDPGPYVDTPVTFTIEQIINLPLFIQQIFSAPQNQAERRIPPTVQ